MKIIIISLVSLLVGVGVGWYFGYTRPNAQVAREVRQQLREDENDHALAAIFAAEAITYIDSGETQKAVKSLSYPIAEYYCIYATRAGTNEHRLKLRAHIEQLARTNQVVAAQITKEMGYSDIHGKVR
jgi:hypothetical protein